MNSARPFAVDSWLSARLPEGWFTDVAVTIDREEVLIVGTIPQSPSREDAVGDRNPEPAEVTANGTGPAVPDPQAESARIRAFGEQSRAERDQIAQELEAHVGRKVSWGVTYGSTTEILGRFSVPVMTRLSQPQRMVLDRLVEAGVARTRSDALGWCVRLVAQREADWLAQLDQAMGSVRELRHSGPQA